LPAEFQKLQGPTVKIAFTGSKATLAGNSAKALNRLAVLLKANPDVILTIVVHGDGAQAQADLTRNHLLGKGVVAEQVEATAIDGPSASTVELRFRTRR